LHPLDGALELRRLRRSDGGQTSAQETGCNHV
jgi:hypothetical protein